MNRVKSVHSMLALSGRAQSRLLRVSFTEQWVVGLARPKSSRLPTRLDVTELLEPPPGSHFADPFIISQGDKSYIYFEAWRNDNAKGTIWLSVVDAYGRCSQPELVLERPYHISYPFLFNWAGELFMLPETQHNHSIEIFRCMQFPTRWELAATLMEGVDAVDSTLFQQGDRWWMFATGFGDTASKFQSLSLFAADCPFGPWRAHPHNPVVQDLGSARSAGRLFWHNGDLIRPGQDCRLRYGHSIAWNRVEVLNCSDYREICIGRLKPAIINGWIAAHTFNQTGNWRVLDGKRLVRKLNTDRPA